jgi:RNA polymerase sigma-70 factor, ECF subfamily
MPTSELPLASHALSVEPGFEPDRGGNGAVLGKYRAGGAAQSWTFDSVYHTYASFVWRNAVRLGIAHGAIEDVMQEVFLVVYRRLPEFEDRASMKAWLSAILIRVVRAYRRTLRRKHRASEDRSPRVDPDSVIDGGMPSPLDLAERDEAVRELHAILSAMNEARREVLVLSELEQLTAPEIAQALQVNINTVYWRLRTARREFERILFRRRSADARGPR